METDIEKGCPKLADGDVVDGETDEVVRFINSPNNRCGFLKFQYLVALLEIVNLRVTPVPPAAAGGSGKVATSNPNVTVALTVSANPPSKGEGDAFTVDVPQNPICTGKQAGKGRKKPSTSAVIVTEPPPHQSKLCTLTVVPRAPEGIIFYMGELVRAEHPSEPTLTDGTELPERKSFAGRIITRYVDDDGEKRQRFVHLFSVERLHDDAEDAFASVELDGSTWYIPKVRSDGEGDQSIHFISLVQQLISLQKKGGDQPSIPTVRILGQ